MFLNKLRVAEALRERPVNEKYPDTAANVLALLACQANFTGHTK